MRSLSFITLATVLWTSNALAQDPPVRDTAATTAASARIDKDAKNYCAWVHAAASAEAAPLVAPSLFVSGGVVGGVDAGVGASALPPTSRLTAGASYSVSSLVRGIAVSDRADAECALYRNEAIIRTFVQGYRDGESKSALTAALGVYKEAEPKAIEVFESMRAAAAAGRATTIDVTEAEMRLDNLRSRSAQARRQLDTLAKRSVPSAAELTKAIAEQGSKEAEVERDLGRIRRTQAWDFAVRGGYDRFFGVRDHVPLFVTATLTVNLGILFQPNAEATEARERWAKSQVEGPVDRASQLTTKLTAIKTEARSRHDATAALVTDLEQRHKALDAIGTDHSKTAANLVWFSLVHAKAERAFYAALLQELDVALRGVPA